MSDSLWVRPFLPSDYPAVSSWWAAQEWPVLPLSMLSSHGFIAEEKGQLLAVAFIYPTEGGNYIMEWTVGNPEVPWELRSAGIKAVTLAGCHWAKAQGAINVFTMTNQKRFIEKLTSLDFKVSGEGMTHLVLNLKDLP